MRSDRLRVTRRAIDRIEPAAVTALIGPFVAIEAIDAAMHAARVVRQIDFVTIGAVVGCRLRWRTGHHPKRTSENFDVSQDVLGLPVIVLSPTRPAGAGATPIA